MTASSDDLSRSIDRLVDGLSVDDEAALGGGASFWRTKSRGEIPEFVLTDGPHGVRFQQGAGDNVGAGASDPATCFPPAVAMAQTWDPDLSGQVGKALSDEAQEKGVSILLGPGINLKRDPRGGRNFEYYSEDPYLTAVLATSYVRALQAGGVGASLKHFAANNAEHDRMRSSSDIDPRPLRELYLRAFERVIRDAEPWTVMCSYNKLNGTPVSENRWLLTDVLRGEWGFEGAVVSDWGAVASRTAAVAAGLDLQMPGDTSDDDKEVVAAVTDGTLDRASVRRAARAVVRTSALAKAGRRDVHVDPGAHHDLAREAARRAIVLLKNDRSTLPLAPSGSIAVVGQFAAQPRYQGGGSSNVTASMVDVPLNEIRDAAPKAAVTFEPGFTTDGSGSNAELLARAVASAGTADVAVVFLGLAAHQESEGFDRVDIEIPSEQLQVLREIATVQRNIVVVVSAGGVLRLAPVAEHAGAVLFAALTGQGGGRAIADILFGQTNPSGKIAETFPLQIEDAPSFGNFPGESSHVRYGEGLFMGYRGYDHRKQQVLYPFGHGLSYTTFDYSNLKAEKSEEGVDLLVTVTNTGDRAGREVVQTYLSVPESAWVRAPRQLVGFASVELKAGASEVVRLTVENRELALWHDVANRWITESGEHVFHVGASSRDLRLSASVQLTGDDVRRPLQMESTIGEVMANPDARKIFEPALSPLIGGTAPAADGEIGIDMALMLGSFPVGRALKNFLGIRGHAYAELERALAELAN